MANPYTVRLNDNEYSALTAGGTIPIRDAILALLQLADTQPLRADRHDAPPDPTPSIDAGGHRLTITVTLE